MKKVLSLFFVVAVTHLYAQQKPKLVVGIVVDQMKTEYLYRFQNDFSENGFKRLMKDGYTFYNMHYNYMPTYTAPGHASVFTGTTPAVHGIVGNEWFNKEIGKELYCTEDETAKLLGNGTESEGRMSPKNLQATTITDELKLATNFKSKVIGLSIKDRGAILPAGHSADGAFWYDSKTGKFISSTYYAKQLPTWVSNYNNQHRVDSLYAKGWNLSLAKSVYEANCDQDINDYESTPLGKEQKSFPYSLSQFIGKDYGKIASTPMGNTILAELAEQAIINEKMGQDDITDLLAVSFSSPDYSGHSFGPDSWETLDGYIKLDATLAKLFAVLDKQVGKNNYTVFLTADHSVVHVPGFAKKHQMPGGTISEDQLKKELTNYIVSKGFDAKLISTIREYNIHFNAGLMETLGVERNKLVQLCRQFLEKNPDVVQVVDARNIAAASLPSALRERIANGYNPQRSGDVFILTKSGYVDGFATGTSHGVLYNYDAHIPLLFWGKGIQHKTVNTPKLS